MRALREPVSAEWRRRTNIIQAWTMEPDIILLTNNMVSGGLLEAAAVTASHSNVVSINNIMDKATSNGQMSCGEQPARIAQNANVQTNAPESEQPLVERPVTGP